MTTPKDPVDALMALKPCPFCGGIAEADSHSEYTHGYGSEPKRVTKWQCSIFCTGCRLFGGSEFGHVKYEGGNALAHQYAMRRITERWNRRPGEASARALAAVPAAEVVPDGVWEALQRMIEDGFNKGQGSRDDARTVSRWRARFVPAREGAQQAGGVPAGWRDTVQRLVTGFEHVSGIARLWEPDHSSGADRAKWARATEACADVAKLLAAAPSPSAVQPLSEAQTQQEGKDVPT